MFHTRESDQTMKTRRLNSLVRFRTQPGIPLPESRPGSPTMTIRAKYVKTFDKKYFLPRGELTRILTHDIFRTVLRRQLGCSLEELDDVFAKISGDEATSKRIKIFAILASTGELGYIRNFIAKELCDEHLPLEYEKLHQLLSPDCKTTHLESFCERQWRVHVPILDFSSDEIRIEKYDKDVILPFLEKRSKSRGGHGTVWEVRIHSDHVQGHSTSDNRFALKEFRPERRRLWRDELSVLERFSGPSPGHNHLIKLLFAYEHQDQGYFLIFPLAEGNLADYWEHTLPSNTGVNWLIEQCCGIASGLSKIHHHTSWPNRRLGRHGDIKPENILWFKSSDGNSPHLVVADFTLTRFHNRDTLNHTRIRDRGFSMTYRAPEIDLQSPPNWPQRYDVWSLGCLFLEFLSWHLFGNAALGRKKASVGSHGQSRQTSSDFTDDRNQLCQNFSDARVHDDNCRFNGAPEDKFFNVLPDGDSSAVVKESVQEWIDFLHRSCSCSEALHEFLELIQDHMLLTNPADRCKMDQVASELGRILERSSDDAYRQQGIPRLDQDGSTHPPKRFITHAQINVMTDSSLTTDLDPLMSHDEDLDEINNVISDHHLLEADLEEDVQDSSENIGQSLFPVAEDLYQIVEQSPVELGRGPVNLFLSKARHVWKRKLRRLKERLHLTARKRPQPGE